MLRSMLDADDCLAWMVLTRAPRLDAATLAGALDLLGSARAILDAAPPALARAALPPLTREFLLSRAARPSATERRWLEGERHALLPVTHPAYPPLLRSLPDPPIALYVAGSVTALAEPLLAVVGSRSPTPQGRNTARAFAADLAARGLGICSGLAEGIDACAHRGALDAQGITVGILGSGIDVVYPACNRPLFAELERHGALLGELPLGTAPRRANFPRRNRLIAGLSLGTLVVEAARRSGSLITARHANQYGREVFAVPGSLHNPLSGGCHELIKAGAKLTETSRDILQELNFSAFFANHLQPSEAPLPRPQPTAGMDKDRKILLDALGFDPVDLDTMVVRSGFKPEAVSSMMLILELEGHVQAAPGGRYSRAVYRRAGGER